MISAHIDIFSEQLDYTAQNSETETGEYHVLGKCWKSQDGVRVSYKEPAEDDSRTITTVTVLPSGAITVNRVGFINTCMTFEEGIAHASIYDTGFFQAQIIFRAQKVCCSLTDHGGCIDLEYTVEISGQTMGKNRLKLVVTPASPVVKN